MRFPSVAVVESTRASGSRRGQAGPSGDVACSKEILREPLQHPAGFVHFEILVGIEAAGDRHLDTLSALAMDHERAP